MIKSKSVNLISQQLLEKLVEVFNWSFHTEILIGHKGLHYTCLQNKTLVWEKEKLFVLTFQREEDELRESKLLSQSIYICKVLLLDSSMFFTLDFSGTLPKASSRPTTTNMEKLGGKDLPNCNTSQPMRGLGYLETSGLYYKHIFTIISDNRK